MKEFFWRNFLGGFCREDFWEEFFGRNYYLNMKGIDVFVKILGVMQGSRMSILRSAIASTSHLKITYKSYDEASFTEQNCPITIRR